MIPEKNVHSDSEDPHRGRRQYDRSIWTDGVHILLAQLKLSLDENTKATLAMAGRINMFFLVPLAVCAMGAATWALFQSKISEHSWLAVMLGCLAQFFGEGIKKIIEGAFPWSRKAAEAKAAGIVMALALAACVFLAGCGTIQNSERTYAASYDADEKMGTVSVTLRPVTPTAQAIQRTTSLDEKQLAALIKQVMDQNRFPNVVETPALK